MFLSDCCCIPIKHVGGAHSGLETAACRSRGRQKAIRKSCVRWFALMQFVVLKFIRVKIHWITCYLPWANGLILSHWSELRDKKKHQDYVN